MRRTGLLFAVVALACGVFASSTLGSRPVAISPLMTGRQQSSSAAIPTAVAKRVAATNLTVLTEIRNVYKHNLLAQYFGPPQTACNDMTLAVQQSVARINHAKNCAAAIDQGIKVIRGNDPCCQHPSPAEYRRLVAWMASRVRITSLLGSQATITDTYYDRITLTRVRGRWLFSRNFPSVQI